MAGLRMLGVRTSWLVIAPVAVICRALRVRLSVQPRSRYWDSRYWDSRYTDSRHPDSRASAAQAPHEIRLIALGDSLTQGIGSSRPATSWLGRFISHLRSGPGQPRIIVQNRSVYGARIADVLATQLPLPAATDLVTLCIGSNDAGRTPLTLFQAQLRAICDQLPDGSIVGDVPEFQWGSRIQAAAELSAGVREVLTEYPKLLLAEVERHTAGTKILTELAGDFFHPGDRGYDRIAKAFITAADQSVLLPTPVHD